MNTALQPEMITAFLRRVGLNFVVNQDNQHLLGVDGLAFVIAVEATNVLVVRALIPVPDGFDSSALPGFINDWSRNRRWPCLFLSEEAELIGEAHQILVGSVSQEQVDRVIATVIEACVQASRELQTAAEIDQVDLDGLLEQLLET